MRTVFAEEVKEACEAARAGGAVRVTVDVAWLEEIAANLESHELNRQTVANLQKDLIQALKGVPA